MHKFFPITLLTVLVVFIVPFFVLAQDAEIPPPSLTPVPFTFPSCTYPTGTVIANYSTGIHGIVGDSSIRTGSDTVYSLSSGNVLQCFCPTGGSAGIQTNWLNASTFSSGDVDLLIADGWAYIVSGLAWGLSDIPYLTKNISYNCAPSGGSSGGSGSVGSGGEHEESVLGISILKHASKAKPHISDPTIAGDIAVLPATGMNIVVAMIALAVFVSAVAVRIFA